MSVISEEALDLSNDLINNNLVLSKHNNSLNDRASMKMTIKTESRLNESPFALKPDGSIGPSDMINQFSIPQNNDQALAFPVNCIDSSRILNMVTADGGDPTEFSRLVNQSSGGGGGAGGLRSHEKLTEYFAQAYQEQQQQQQISHLQSILAAILTSSPNNVMAPWLSTKTALTSILQQLPAPTSSLVSFASLHSLYANIQNTCVSLDKLLEQYFILFISAFLKTQEKSLLNPHLLSGLADESSGPKSGGNGAGSHPSAGNANGTLANSINSAANNLKRKSVSPQRCKPQKSPNNSSIDYQSTYSTVNLPPDDSNSNSNLLYSSIGSDPGNESNLSVYIHNSSSRLFKRKKMLQNSNNSNNTSGSNNGNTNNANSNSNNNHHHHNNNTNNNNNNNNKKSNFRGTSEAENEIDTSFMPREVNREIILCEEYSNVHLDKEVYNTLTSKAPRSATRLIRLLMKHFFSQDTLARSSLSGEGIYKDRLQPDVIEAIKLFIKRRHPKLKNGSINLCMTDVCVQARRVNKNQRTRLPSSTDVNSKTADSATSDGYSPTMFSGISNPTGGSGMGSGGYNLLTTTSGSINEIGTKPNSPESGNNSLSSRGHNNTGSPLPYLMTSTNNHRSSPDTSIE